MGVCGKVFIAWSRLSSRTLRYAKELGVKVIFIRDRPPYFRCLYHTIAKLLRGKYKIVFVQLAPGPLLLIASILKYIKRFVLVADMHSFFMLPSSLGGYLINKPFGFFLRFCDLILIHSKEVKDSLPSSIRRKALVAYDPPIFRMKGKRKSGGDAFTIVFPASFARDEPIENIILAVKKLAEKGMNIRLVITGRYERRRELLKFSDGKTIIFTGYLPMDKYYDVIYSADMIAGLTKVSYSLMAVALEAMFAEKPLLLSDKPVFKAIFDRGVVYTDNTVSDLIAKISYVYKNRDLLERLGNGMAGVKLKYLATYRAIVGKLRELMDKICTISTKR